MHCSGKLSVLIRPLILPPVNFVNLKLIPFFSPDTKMHCWKHKKHCKILSFSIGGGVQCDLQLEMTSLLVFS